MNRTLSMAVVAGVLGLAGCSDDDSARAFCNAFPNVVFAGQGCINCAVADGDSVDDRNLETAARIVPETGATSETATFSITAGIPIAGGATVGAFVTQPSTLNSTVNTFKTYLDGTLQETSGAQNGVVEPAQGGTPAQGFIGMRTTKEFDSIEFVSANTWSAGKTPVYYVYELCSDGGNS